MEPLFEVETAKEPEEVDEVETPIETRVENTIVEEKQPTIIDKWRTWLNNLMNEVAE